MIAAKEAWIEHVEDFPADIRNCDSKYSFLQSLYQVRYVPGCIKTYKKLVVRINKSNDFSNANPIQISVGSSNEDWTLHSLKIYRAEAVIDKTTTISFSELQRETGLENNVITGTKTFVAHIDDLQIGDIVSYEYTTTNTNPVYAHHFEYFLGTSFVVPLYHLRFQLSHDNPQKRCAVRVYDGINEVTRDFVGESGSYSFEKYQIDAVVLEENIPNDRSPFSHIEFSDYSNWSEFGNSVKQYYQSDEYMRETIKDYAKSIVKDCNTQAQIIEKLVRHVQRNVAYLSLSLNEHSYLPHSPISVVQNNYGDCKDKTLLLKTLLMVYEIESTAVLVHTAFSKNTPSRLPALGCFNHVILSIKFGEDQFLVDPTNPYDCFSIDNYSEPYYYSGLYLEDNTHLKLLSEKKNGKYLRNIVEHFTIKGNTATLLVQDEYYYYAFPRVAHRHTTVDRDICKKSYLDFYSERYPTISYQSEISDGSEFAYKIDDSKHCLAITAKFHIHSLWTEVVKENVKRKQVVFFPSDLREVLYELPATTRKLPFSWAHEAELRLRYVIDYDFNATMGSLDEKIDNNLFSYSVVTEEKPRLYTYDLHYKSKSDTIEASDYAVNQKLVREFLSTLGFTIALPHQDAETSTTDNREKGMSTGARITIGFFVLILLRILFAQSCN